MFSRLSGRDPLKLMSAAPAGHHQRYSTADIVQTSQKGKEPNAEPALSTVRYTLRQFRMSPVFTMAATLTLPLGICGTTPIFTLIHATMLRSLPVSDPALLVRIGDDCCVEGGPQDPWGMSSFPLLWDRG
jgi:hypothetical protein